jgi:hypothetical protein
MLKTPELYIFTAAVMQCTVGKGQIAIVCSSQNFSFYIQYLIMLLLHCTKPFSNADVSNAYSLHT